MKIETSSTNSAATSNSDDMLERFKNYVIATRKFGHTYIHADVRHSVCRWSAVTGSLDGRAVVGRFCEYGKSIQNGGSKYKAHLNFLDTGKPVPSKMINAVTR
jgi:hypothetical protein